MKKNQSLVKYIIGLVISVSVNWLAVFFMGVRSCLDLAKDNEYYRIHLQEKIIYAFCNSFYISLEILVILLFTIFFFVLRGIILKQNISRAVLYLVLPIISNILSFFVLFLWTFGAFAR